MNKLTDADKRQIIQTGIDILGTKFNTRDASIIMAAIAYQESNFFHRKQIIGPARGLWQFEMNGGVIGVLRHSSSAKLALEVCRIRKVEHTTKNVYDQLEHDDVLAAAFARLLLWTDPKPIPSDPDSAWQYYLKIWRPGKPHPGRWKECWSNAVDLYK